MIIGYHCHAGKGDGPLGHARRFKNYLVWAKEAGIEKTVLFAALHSDYAIASRLLAKTVIRRPDRFFGLAFIHANRDCGRNLVDVAVNKYGFFVDIKVHRHDAPISREICDVARL